MSQVFCHDHIVLDFCLFKHRPNHLLVSELAHASAGVRIHEDKEARVAVLHQRFKDSDSGSGLYSLVRLRSFLRARAWKICGSGTLRGFMIKAIRTKITARRV